MKSLSQWRREKTALLREFAGPRGQTDPMDMGRKYMTGGNAAVAAPVNGVQPNSGMQQDPLPSSLNSFMRILSSKPANYIMTVRQQIEDEIGRMLKEKGDGYARRGMMQNFNQARDMKANWGKTSKIAPEPNSGL